MAALAVGQVVLLLVVGWGSYQAGRRPLPACQAQVQGLERRGQAMVARQRLLEALVGLFAGDAGMAFDRVVGAQFAAQAAGLHLEQDFMELSLALQKQAPDVKGRVLKLADKIQPLVVATRSPQ